jgi:hypothetical protein
MMPRDLSTATVPAAFTDQRKTVTAIAQSVALWELRQHWPDIEKAVTVPNEQLIGHLVNMMSVHGYVTRAQVQPWVDEVARLRAEVETLKQQVRGGN